MRDASHLLDLRLACLRAREPEPEHREMYESVYRLWHRLWAPARQQIEQSAKIPSDTFLRHVEIAALFHHDEPIATMLFDAFNLNSPVDLEHSYFKNFSPETLTSIRAMNFKNVMTFGNLAVTPSWRGPDAAIAELMIGLSVVRFAHSHFDAVIAYTRNTKGVHHMAYRCGAEAVLTNGEAFGEPADFVVFDERSPAVLNLHPRRALMQRLWDHRIQEDSRHSLFMNFNRERLCERSLAFQLLGEPHEQHLDADR